jgi:hypothetical protein
MRCAVAASKLGAGCSAEQARAGDAFQRPLRSRFQACLTRGVRLQKAGCPGVNICRNIRRNIQRYWILRRLCRSISCSAAKPSEEKIILSVRQQAAVYLTES